ncbi:outer membrane protein assembly factor BamB family protein [Dictyobacter kobayashii]|uniref:Pyrrolo-quinoline quinone repeat domain-containing protein n=1 Tax=Dictyobacter kobayashii TaxID=2014872 RepID=A0A402ARA6_9CHLR|nr:PQQ-binding-like beta-propeller repeat protein [Dictyobacter kobayashii]GCE21625.1 hypothetical protein KDK_54250 [Dictyobacter kobayashii]
MAERKDIVEPCAPQFYPQITLKQVASQVVEHTLYFASGVYLYALNAGTGALKWGLSIKKAPFKSTTLPDGMIFTGPPPLDSLVGLAAQQDRVFVSSLNSFVYALVAVDGTIIWQHEIDLASGMPTIAGETIYVPSSTIYALNTKDGVERWNLSTKGVVTSVPVIVDNTLYIGSYDNNIYALDIENGQARWTYQTDGRVYIDPIVDQGTVYAGAGNDGPCLLALDAQSGELKWQNSVFVDSMSQLLVHEGLLYVCQRDHLVGLDPKNGRPVWKYPGINNASLLASRHTLYVAASSGDVYAFDCTRHRLLWRQKLRTLTIGQPSHMKLIADELYVGFNEHGRGQHGTVHAINVLTGSEDWSASAEWVNALDVNEHVPSM